MLQGSRESVRSGTPLFPHQAFVVWAKPPEILCHSKALVSHCQHQTTQHHRSQNTHTFSPPRTIDQHEHAACIGASSLCQSDVVELPSQIWSFKLKMEPSFALAGTRPNQKRDNKPSPAETFGEWERREASTRGGYHPATFSWGRTVPNGRPRALALRPRVASTIW